MNCLERKQRQKARPCRGRADEGVARLPPGGWVGAPTSNGPGLAVLTAHSTLSSEELSKCNGSRLPNTCLTGYSVPTRGSLPTTLQTITWNHFLSQGRTAESCLPVSGSGWGLPTGRLCPPAHFLYLVVSPPPPPVFLSMLVRFP